MGLKTRQMLKTGYKTPKMKQTTFDPLSRLKSKARPKDDKDQRLTSIWYCNDCEMKIKTLAVPTHRLNKHNVEHFNYDPSPLKRKK